MLGTRTFPFILVSYATSRFVISSRELFYPVVQSLQILFNDCVRNSQPILLRVEGRSTRSLVNASSKLMSSMRFQLCTPSYHDSRPEANEDMWV